MPILDQNNRPIAPQGNGQKERDKHDVRTIPTGTLIFNLIRFTGEEVGMENMLHQLEQVKRQQKMVTDPPEIKAVREHLEQLTQHRYIVCVELNERFAEVDQMRMAKLGIEVVTPLAAYVGPDGNMAETEPAKED